MSEHSHFALARAYLALAPDRDALADRAFWKLLCEDLSVDFSWPLKIETAKTICRALIACDGLSSLSLEKWGLDETIELSKSLATKLLTALPKPIENQEHLRAYAIQVIHQETGMSWNEAASATLARAPDLMPRENNRSGNSPEKAIDSRRRKNGSKLADYEAKIKPAKAALTDSLWDELDLAQREALNEASKWFRNQFETVEGPSRYQLFLQFQARVSKFLSREQVQLLIDIGTPTENQAIIDGANAQAIADEKAATDKAYSQLNVDKKRDYFEE